MSNNIRNAVFTLETTHQNKKNWLALMHWTRIKPANPAGAYDKIIKRPVHSESPTGPPRAACSLVAEPKPIPQSRPLWLT